MFETAAPLDTSSTVSHIVYDVVVDTSRVATAVDMTCQTYQLTLVQSGTRCA